MNVSKLEEHLRLLIVDDNHAIHDDFEKIFRTQSQTDLDELDADLFGESAPRIQPPEFRLDSAFQGQEALARVKESLAKNSPYSVAFIDIRMPPGWDGVETAIKLWEIHPELQVVLCTAYSDYSWSEMLTKLGLSDRLFILKKPFDNIEVLQLATALTEKWRLLKELKSRIRTLEQRLVERTHELQISEARFRRGAENKTDLIARDVPGPSEKGGFSI